MAGTTLEGGETHAIYSIMNLVILACQGWRTPQDEQGWREPWRWWLWKGWTDGSQGLPALTYSFMSQEDQRHSPLMIRTSWRWKGEGEAGGTAGGAGAEAGLSRCIVVSALCSHFRLFKHILQVCSTERAGGGQQQHLYYCIM